MRDVRQIIKDLIKEKGSLRQVARDLSLDHGNLSRSLNADSNPRLNTIEKLLDYLGYEIRIVKSKKLTKY